MSSENLKELTYSELQCKWADLWGTEPVVRMGRVMLEASIEFKLHEQKTGGLPHDQRKRLEGLIRAYKRDPRSLDKTAGLKPGTYLVRTFKGKKHSVLVTLEGFEYDGRQWTSLSQIANHITGARWNGWVFFGIKQKEMKP